LRRRSRKLLLRKLSSKFWWLQTFSTTVPVRTIRVRGGGAWGPSAANAFEEVLAVKAATTNRELTDFSIIKFAKHWREAVGVAILRGAAAVVAQAAPMGAEGEWVKK
jgi:hypothetical protein